MSDIAKKDWALYRERLPGWQEEYMEKLNREYIALLRKDAPASDKFWELEERIRKDKKKAGVQVQIRRSDMEMNLLKLISEGAITLDDLEGFSDDLRERLSYLAKEYLL